MALEAKTGNQHFHEALVKLIPPYWGKPRIAALLYAMVKRVQGLEDAAWEVIEKHTINGADTARLDVLGRVVGQPRYWSDDEIYRKVLRARIRTSRSRGLTEDVIQVVRLIMALTTEVVRVYHYAPATMAVLPTAEVTDEDVTALMFLMPKTRAAGVQAHYFLAPEGAGTYDFDSLGIDLDNTADPGTVPPGLFDVRIL